MTVSWRQRVVEVLQRKGPPDDDGWSLGSGYLVGGSWVLTAAHVIDTGDGMGEILVRRLDPLEGAPKRVWTAKIKLRGDPSLADLALLKLDDGGEEKLPDVAPVGLGRINRDAAFARVVPGCSAIGFPEYKSTKTPSGARKRDTAQIDGVIPIADMADSGLLVLKVTYPPEQVLDRQKKAGLSPYSGMSGAAVTVGELVVGLIKEHLTADGKHLSLTPFTALDRLGKTERRRWAQFLDLDARLDEVRHHEPLPLPPEVVNIGPRHGRPVCVVLPNLGCMTAAHRGSLRSLVSSLTDDLRQLCRSQKTTPTMILVPGAVARNPVPAEYRAAEAVIDGVRADLGIPVDRVVVAPSPHDVSGVLYDEYLTEQRIAGVAPVLPYAPKWRHLFDFLGRVGTAGQHRITDARPWAWWESPAERICVAVLNATINSTGIRPEPPRRLGTAQLDEVGARVLARKTDGWLCIGLLYDRLAHDSEDGLEDADVFLARVAVHLDLVVQGRPAGFSGRLTTFGTTPVLAPGDVAAGYQVVDLGPRGMVWSRTFDPDRTVWIGDRNIANDPRLWWRTLPLSRGTW